MSKFFQLKTFITYWLEAVDEHSLHSPFFFDFYTKVIRQERDIHNHAIIEDLRKKLLSDDRAIFVDDLGGGSYHFTVDTRKISSIAKTSLSTRKFATLYYSIAHYFDAKNIVELGTSFGINTLYLSQKGDAHITTFEGSKAIADMARTTFELAGSKNITLIEGNINLALPVFLQASGKIDLVFIDANHRYKPTRKYFDWLLPKMHYKSVLIVDDIHQSEEMEQAWNEIRMHPLVYGSVDLYRCGLTFFDPTFTNQSVVLQF